MRRAALLAAMLWVILPLQPAAAQQVQRERVHIEPGTQVTTIRDRIAGRDSHEYLVALRAGQRLQLRLLAAGPNIAFNVFAPGDRPGAAEALFRGEVSGATAELLGAVDGDYLIQVFQNRAAARRGERAAFTLQVGVLGGEAGPPPWQGSAARILRGSLDAKAEIPCAVGLGAPMGRCPAGVARGPGGEATVRVTQPGGGMRLLFFAEGRLAGTDASEADVAARPQVQREGDLTIIRLGRERYEVSDAFILGG